jgi:hypothetical protein
MPASAGGQVAPAGNREPARKALKSTLASLARYSEKTRCNPSMRADSEPSRRCSIRKSVRANLENCDAAVVSGLARIERGMSVEYLQATHEQQRHRQRVDPVCQPREEAVSYDDSGHSRTLNVSACPVAQPICIQSRCDKPAMKEWLLDRHRMPMRTGLHCA